MKILLLFLLPVSLLVGCQSVAKKTHSTLNVDNVASLISPQHAISRTIAKANNVAIQQQVIISEENKQLIVRYIETNVSDEFTTTFERRPNNCFPGQIYYRDDDKLIEIEDEVIIDIFSPSEDIVLAPNESHTFNCLPGMLRRFPTEQKQYLLTLIQLYPGLTISNEDIVIIDIPFTWQNNAPLSKWLKSRD